MKQIKIHIIYLLGIFTMLIAQGCVHNESINCTLYGMWRTESIEINSEPDSTYEGNLFFSFQSNVVKFAGIYNFYGTWEANDDYSELTMWFDLPGQDPVPGSPIVAGENKFIVEKFSSKSIILRLVTNDNTTYRYTLEKWN